MEIENLGHNLKVEDILNITKGKLIIGDTQQICENFKRDSREIEKDDIYLGIKGEKINGGIFFEEAFIKGAKGAILQEIDITEEQRNKYKDKFIIIVKDTVLAMQKIATYKRNLYKIPVVAITGSVGKTSTKDIIASVISQQFNTLKTQGNYNNHIGVPLTVLSLKNEEAMVVEMGMNHLGEISTLTKIAKPNIAIITNVGTAHIGNLGSRENILKAKLEILEGLSKDGYIIINNDNDLLHKWYIENKENKNIITYGIENESKYMAQNIILKENGSIYTLNKTQKQITVPISGKHFIQNSLCAIAVGETLNIPIEKIKDGIEKFKLTQKRMDITKIEPNITIINDSYNASYESMKASLEILSKYKGRKIAILGDMLELGKYSKELHQKVGEEVIKNNIDILITVGKESKYISEIAKQKINKIIECNSNEEAIMQINKIKRENDYILLKASNGMKLYEIAEKLK